MAAEQQHVTCPPIYGSIAVPVPMSTKLITLILNKPEDIECIVIQRTPSGAFTINGLDVFAYGNRTNSMVLITEMNMVHGATMVTAAVPTTQTPIQPRLSNPPPVPSKPKQPIGPKPDPTSPTTHQMNKDRLPWWMVATTRCCTCHTSLATYGLECGHTRFTFCDDCMDSFRMQMKEERDFVHAHCVYCKNMMKLLVPPKIGIVHRDVAIAHRM